MIVKLAEYVGAPILVVMIAATLLYFDFVGHLTRESYASTGERKPALLDVLVTEIPSLPLLRAEFP